MTTEESRSPEPAPRHSKKAKQSAEYATIFGIMALVFGVIAISQGGLAAVAIAMGALGLYYSPREAKTNSTGKISSILGIVLGGIAAIMAIVS